MQTAERPTKLMILPWGLLTLAALAWANAGCATGPCTYTDIVGVATITAVTSPAVDDPNCDNEPLRVIFDFEPADEGATGGYLFPDWSDEALQLTVAGGMNPSSQWIEEQGLDVTSEHACLRQECRTGSCTPVVFHFPDLDLVGAIHDCWDE